MASSDQGPRGAGEPLLFDYRFLFQDGSQKRVPIRIDPRSLQYLPERELTPNAWTRLDFHQCENCPFDVREIPHCPVALSIQDIVSKFQDRVSHEPAEVHVKTRERRYYENTTMQKGLSSILGILMVTSGCPILDKLRPMVRFHLPFPSLLETTFRTTGTYLLGQFFRMKQGRSADFTFQGLAEIYRDIKQVNKAMVARVRELGSKDAGVNALILLDLFAVDVPLSIRDQIAELEPFFRRVIDEAPGPGS